MRKRDVTGEVPGANYQQPVCTTNLELISAFFFLEKRMKWQSSKPISYRKEM